MKICRYRQCREYGPNDVLCLFPHGPRMRVERGREERKREGQRKERREREERERSER